MLMAADGYLLTQNKKASKAGSELYVLYCSLILIMIIIFFSKQIRFLKESEMGHVIFVILFLTQIF
jgi:hypothetical protein